MSFFEIKSPNKSYYVDVSKIHSLYVEEYGNESGIPVLFLHGGPGAGCSSEYQKFFNPKKYRLVLFDQRGCGKSTPYGEVRENTSDELVNDIDKILDFIGIDKTIIYGGSWGSTLALLYSQHNPDRVKSLVLRGVFLCRKKDIEWFYQYGASEIYPHYWKDYINVIDPNKRHDLLKSYHELIFSDDEDISRDACRAWSNWEGKSSCLELSKHVIQAFDDCSISLARIESHFFINDCFIDENQILEKIDLIQDIPCFIVHGQYDVVCPIRQAYDLNMVYHKSKLFIAQKSGHSLLEPEISNEILNIFNNEEL